MRPLTLMYHRVNTLRPDPWTTCVSPGNFAEHLQVVRALDVPFTVTFDDGYADNFENAAPLLARYDVPATIFVTSGCVDSPFEMWWDELERKYLAATPDSWDWDDDDTDPGAALYREAFHRYRRQPFTIFAPRPTSRTGRRMMTAGEISTLAASGLIQIGAHTVTHPVLSQLTLDRQRQEITKSKTQLEEITGLPVSHFAYPNGGPDDYTPETVRLVREAGFVAAYAAWEGAGGRGSDPFQIPRIMVRDWNGDVFASVLRKKLSV